MPNDLVSKTIQAYLPLRLSSKAREFKAYV
jgi:hypothetical protein